VQLTIPSGVIKWFFYAETGVGDLKIDSAQPQYYQ